MKIINPVALTDGTLFNTNVAEDDHPEWDVSTTYAASDRVIVLSTHAIYESLVGSNLGNDPTTDDGTNWLFVCATNRWKSFDTKISDQTVNDDLIWYQIELATITNAVALFNTEAVAARVRVWEDDTLAVLNHDEVKQLYDDSEIVDYYTFFTTDLTGQLQKEVLFSGFTAFPGNVMEVRVGSIFVTGPVRVGEVAYGRIVELGETLEGSELGLTSFSTKEQDQFGNWNIVPRTKSDPINFQFAMIASDAARVKRTLNSLRDTPAVYFADETLVAAYGAITYGFFQDYTIPLRRNGRSIVDLEIEGLT